jgi:hypothetical protein
MPAPMPVDPDARPLTVTERGRDRLERHMVHRLEGVGYKVLLRAADPAA